MRQFTEQVAAPDGTLLATDVRLPDGEGPWPATLFRTPYLRSNEFLPLFPDEQHQLAVVLQDVRGRHGSQGRFDMGGSDIGDGAATIGWIAQQPWCNGRVAMHGISYAGHTQLQAARAKPPALQTIAPIRCPAWWRPLTMHEGGAWSLSLAAHWLPLQAAEAPGCPPATRDALSEIALQFEQICTYPPGPPTPQGTLDLAKVFAHPGLTRRPYRDRREYDGVPDYAAVWRSFFERPFTGSWLHDSGPAPGDDPQCDVLLIGGWYDCWAKDAVAMFQALQRARRGRHRLVMRPSSHAPDPAGERDLGYEARRYDDLLSVTWTEELLQGNTRLLDELAPVTWFHIGANVWRESEAWPPPQAMSMDFFLGAAESRSTGVVLSTAPNETGSVTFVYDPRDPLPTMGGASLGLPPGSIEQARWSSEHRPDVVSFTGAVFAEPLDLAGPVVAEIHLASDARDTDVVVKLLDVFPDGRIYNIADGIVRGRFRNGREELLVPGEPAVFAVHCWDIAYRIDAGHRLRVDVTSSSFPKYEPNANTGNPLGSDTDADLRVAHQTVLTGPSHPSRIRLTALPASH